MTPEEVLEQAGQVLETEARSLLAARTRLGAPFVAAVGLVHDRCPPGKVVVMGVGKSGHIANKIAATLASTGTPAFFVHPTEAGHGDLGMITSGDVVMAISFSGKSAELLSLFPYFKRHAIPLVAITGNPHSRLAQLADHSIDAGIVEEACPLGLAPTSSTTLALAIGDALAICLLKKRGLTPEQFVVTHPHGNLGRRLLLQVEDIMLKGAEVPAVRPETTVRDSVVEMSRGGIGITAVVDEDRRLRGVFTDGDLRRALDHGMDINSTAISKLMTASPKTVRANQLAVEVAEVMERNKILAVLVVDAEGRLSGALNMRIMLQAGVI